MGVTIYFKNGNSALFREVEDFDIITDKENGNYIAFTYSSDSKRTKLDAMFYLNNIAGFADQID